MTDKRTITTSAFTDQKPGTSGLRKKVTVFQQAHYLENFVQSIFSTQAQLKGGILVLGGDGRYYNDVAIQTIIRMAAANGVAKVLVGKSGILSTPAASHLIRHFQAQGGIVLSASHNPAGVEGDFGIKYNIENGGPAPEKVTEDIFAACCAITTYQTVDSPDIDIDTVGSFSVAKMRVEIVDSVEIYAAYMQTLFDFPAIAALLQKDTFRFVFDAMHAVTGPYAQHIFETLLGAPVGTVIKGVPLPDFGGGHPDPNLTYAPELVAMTQTASQGEAAIDFAAASDGDGDRNMILGKDFFVTPSDSLAFIFANAELIPAYRGKVTGVARSMPTSQAADRVANVLGLPCFETPTGWKFFGNLLDSNQITFCGEESFGTSSNHVREKDGLWAVLAWLNILAVKQQSVQDLMLAHWQQFGRNFYTRYDYEAVEAEAAHALVAALQEKLPELPGTELAGETVAIADQFAYTDPVDGSVSENQGIRIVCASGTRVVVRLSGTGTEGATLRVYLESYSNDASTYSNSVAQQLAKLVQSVVSLLSIEAFTKRTTPTVIT